MVTSQLVRDLVQHGIIIISGLAYGIDSIAHQATLEAGGQTIAVLPAGLDDVYPAAHRPLAKQILEQGGALVTEYPEGTTSYPSNFIARNRIVSGLSRAVLITEAAEKSGTLHTANFALEQGRDVMSVPADINRLQSVGCNNLIKQGAIPVTSVADILAQLQIPTQPWPEHESLAMKHEEFVILTLLKQGISDQAELLDRSNLTASVFGQTVTMLELDGRLIRIGAQLYPR
jgi:DNA processing protein